MLAENDDKKNYIVYRGKKVFIVLNAYPYNPGHIMITPYRHVGRVDLLTDEEANEAFALVRKSVSIIENVSHPHGFNVGMNLGATAGAGVVDHVHIHVVPRYNGDTNFMPVLSQTKVVSDALSGTYDLLKPAFEK